MAMIIEGQCAHEIGVLSENRSWGFSNFDNSSDCKEKLTLDLSKKEGKNEGEPLVSKRRSLENARGSGKKVIDAKGNDGKSCKLDNEIHILNERDRRKKMMNMFATLHALLPELPSKANKSTIIDETVKYIKCLNLTMKKLEKQKRERLQLVSTFGCESYVVNSQWYPNGSEQTFIAGQGSTNNFTSAIGNLNPTNSTILSVPRQPVAFETWSYPNVVLNICGNEAQFCIYATRKPGLLTAIAYVLEKHRIDVITANIFCNGNENRYMILAHANRTSYPLILQTTPVGEIYKQAATEIRQWIS